MNATRHPLLWLGLFIIAPLLAMTVAEPAWLTRLPSAFDQLFHDQRAILLTENDVLRTRLSEAQTVIAEGKALAAGQLSDIETLRADLDEYRDQIDRLASDRTTIIRDRDALDETLAERTRERDDLEQRLTERRRSQSRAEAENRRLLEERRAILQERDSLEATNQDLQVDLEHARKETDVRSAAIEQEATDRETLSRELDAKNETLASLESALKDADADRTSSLQAFESAERKAANLTRREADLVQRLSDSEKRLGKAVETRREAETRLGEATAKLDEQTTRTSGLEADLAQQRADAERLEADRATLEVEGERLNGLVHASNTRAEKRAEQSATYVAALIQITAERDSLRRDIDVTEAALQAAQAAAKAREENLVSLERELTAMTDRGLRLENERRKRRAEIDRLIADRKESAREIIRLASLLGTLDRATRRQRDDDGPTSP